MLVIQLVNWFFIGFVICDEFIDKEFTISHFLDSTDQVFDLLKVDDKHLLNLMDPIELFNEFQLQYNESIDLDTLLLELDSIYLNLLNFADTLSDLSPEDLLKMADSLSEMEYYNVFDSSHKHKEFVDSVEFEPLTIESNITSYDDPILDSLLAEEIDEEEDEEDSDDGISAQGVFKLLKLKKFKNMLKKKIMKKKKKTSKILKILYLKKIIKRKRLMTCIKIMMTIEKIKRTISLIKKLLIKKILYLIKEFPFDTLWKFKVLLRLIVKIIDDLIWSSEIKILTVIAKTFELFKFLKLVPIELALYFKSELFGKLSTLKQIDVIENEDLQFDNYNDYFNLNEVNYDYYNDNGIDYSISEPKLYPDEIENIYKKSFDIRELKNLLNFDDVFNFDIDFEEDESFAYAKV